MKFELTAKRLRKALDNANMTARELSIKSGVSEASISQYLNGSHSPSNISSGKMANYLHVNPLWLMGFDEPMTKMYIDENGKVGGIYDIEICSPEEYLIEELSPYWGKLSDGNKERIIEYAKRVLALQEMELEMENERKHSNKRSHRVDDNEMGNGK